MMKKIFNLFKKQQREIMTPPPPQLGCRAFTLAEAWLKTLARDFFALERGAGAARANEEFDLRYITAEHGEDARLGQMRGQKPAFTLAEVLITLAVIGIVAALTIGIFLPKIHSTIRARQIATAEVKFTKAMEQMALNNAIGPYYETTQEFVDELQNYLKVSKVCANDKLEECFGYDKLLLANGEEFELAEIKSGENLGKTADNTEYLETVGIVTIDGTGMILSWDKKCPILEPKVYAWGNNTNETTSCVAAIMDINLDKSPNRIGKDIARFRAESPSKTSCGMEFTVGGQKYCWGTPFTPTPITKAQCEQVQGINECNYDTDYWAGAYKQCKDEGKHLPTLGELAKLAAYLYDKETVGDTELVGKAINTSKFNNLPSEILPSYQTNGYFYLWSGVENSKLTAYGRYFYSTYTAYDYYTYRCLSTYLGVCVP